MRIALLGDIGLLGSYSLSSNDKLLDQLNPISQFLNKFDLVVGNLETPFSFKKETFGSKSSYICTDPINIEVLKTLHVNAVSIANNHIFDFGREGFETTIQVLENAGIAWFGANGKDYKIEQCGNRILFNGFCCYSTNPLKIAKNFGKKGINGFDFLDIKKFLYEKNSEGWLNIFAIHSGIEHVNTPSLVQIWASRDLANIAPYVWYGHHPHMIQGIEEYKGSLIAHSLGNFCFAGNTKDVNRPIIELTDNNRTGMILALDVVENKIVEHKEFLTRINENGEIQILDNSDILQSYSDKIKSTDSNPNTYNKERQQQRELYIAGRKEMRDLKWFIKRLRPRYVLLFLENHLNAKRYRNKVIGPLKKLGYGL